MNKLKSVLFLFLLVFAIQHSAAQLVPGVISVPSPTDTIPPPKIAGDTILPIKLATTDTIPKVKVTGPIVLDKKKYILGGVTSTGNESISEQSILIFSGLVVGQEIKVPGDKLTSAIKKLWNSKLFSNVEIFATKVDGDAIYLEIAVNELAKVGKVDIKGVKKSKVDEIRKEIEFQPGSMLTENLITTTKNQIADKFKEKGYLKTKVNISTKPDSVASKTEDALYYD
ncbi:MAG: POTRA domain-containing protein [Flavobacteriaceae bacterium]|nr:POTRA domain-containing protein [Flavobacteriaceae bacterium]